jgi:ribonuclease HI
MQQLCLPSMVELITEDCENITLWQVETIIPLLTNHVVILDKSIEREKREVMRKKVEEEQHFFWQLAREKKPRPPPLLKNKDDTIISDPWDILGVIDSFWGTIYNKVTDFDAAAYKHRFRVAWGRIKRKPISFPKIEGQEFLQHVKKAKCTAPGLDGRTMEELKSLPLQLWEDVADFFDYILKHPHTTLPKELCEARVSLIPKEEKYEEAPTVEGLRPITVTVQLYRVWSAIVYKRHREWLEDVLPPGILTGRKGGEVGIIVAKILLELEASQAGALPRTVFVTTTDFSKFFDMINWEFMTMIMTEMGMDQNLICLYKNFLKQLRRYWFFDNYTSEDSMSALRGVIQGDAISLIVAALALVVWATELEHMATTPGQDIKADAYVDDRYIVTYSKQDLMRAVDATITHDKLAGFTLNVNKSATLNSKNKKRVQGKHVSIPWASSIKALGYMASMKKRGDNRLVNKRTCKAVNTLKRVNRSNLMSTTQKRRCVKGVAIPQLSFGSWISTFSLRNEMLVTSAAISTFLGRFSHYRASELVITLLGEPHNFSPKCQQIMNSVLTLRRICGKRREVEESLCKLVNFYCVNPETMQKVGMAPAKLIMNNLRLINCTMDGKLQIDHAYLPTFNLVNTCKKAVVYLITAATKVMLWTQLYNRGNREEMPMIKLIDDNGTTRYLKNQSVKEIPYVRKTFEYLVTGATATFERLWRHGQPISKRRPAPEGPNCPFCNCNIPETLNHIFWECGAYQIQRSKLLVDLQEHQGFVVDEMLPTYGIFSLPQIVVDFFKSLNEPEFDMNNHPPPEWTGDGEFDADDDGNVIIYTDGASKHQDERRISRAGCGVYLGNHNPLNLSFRLPGVWQTAYRAELRALVHAVEIAQVVGFSFHVKLDNMAVVDNANDIINDETMPRDDLDLWDRFRSALNGTRSRWQCNPLVTWIKGHTNESDVVNGIISQEERNGNIAADELASNAASSWKCPDAISSLLDKNRKAGRLVQEYQVEVLLMRLQTFIEKYEETEVT